jgi:hypothetical protein
MPNDRMRAKLQGALASLESVRGTFFEVGREAVESSGEAGWRVAKELLALAETVDSVRARVVSLDGTGATPNEGGSAPQQDVVSLPRTAPRRRRSDYPKFFVREDTLVKVGLGRDRRSEYEHTVSRSEFDSVASRIAELLANQRSFDVDQLQAGLSCPVYRTYIVLALLRKTGVLTARQRGKYTAKDAATIASDAERVWTETAASL